MARWRAFSPHHVALAVIDESTPPRQSIADDRAACRSLCFESAPSIASLCDEEPRRRDSTASDETPLVSTRPPIPEFYRRNAFFAQLETQSAAHISRPYLHKFESYADRCVPPRRSAPRKRAPPCFAAGIYNPDVLPPVFSDNDDERENEKVPAPSTFSPPTSPPFLASSPAKKSAQTAASCCFEFKKIMLLNNLAL